MLFGDIRYINVGELQIQPWELELHQVANVVNRVGGYGGAFVQIRVFELRERELAHMCELGMLKGCERTMHWYNVSINSYNMTAKCGIFTVEEENSEIQGHDRVHSGRRKQREEERDDPLLDGGIVNIMNLMEVPLLSRITP